MAALGAISIFSLIFSAIFYIIFAFFLSKIFQKAGIAGWKAWVPVYNSWVMLEIGGQKGFWVLLSFVPVLNIVALVFMILAANTIGQKLGKETWFVLLYIFLSPVWVIWLALDQSTWQSEGNAPTPEFVPPVQPESSPSMDNQTPDSEPVAPTQQPYEQPAAPEQVPPATPSNPNPESQDDDANQAPKPPTGPLIQ